MLWRLKRFALSAPSVLRSVLSRPQDLAEVRELVVLRQRLCQARFAGRTQGHAVGGLLWSFAEL